METVILRQRMVKLYASYYRRCREKSCFQCTTTTLFCTNRLCTILKSVIFSGCQNVVTSGWIQGAGAGSLPLSKNSAAARQHISMPIHPAIIHNVWLVISSHPSLPHCSLLCMLSMMVYQTTVSINKQSGLLMHECSLVGWQQGKCYCSNNTGGTGTFYRAKLLIWQSVKHLLIGVVDCVPLICLQLYIL